MKTIQLLENLEFHDKNPYAEPLHVAKTGRILRFNLRPVKRQLDVGCVRILGREFKRLK